jgi:HlyD family secretion protein
MHRNTKILIRALLLGSSIGGVIWQLNTSEKKRLATTTKTEAPIKMDIIDKRVISGHLAPCKEVALKTEISGILDKLYVAISDRVTQGTAIARIKVLPKSSDIENAKKEVHVAQITQAAAETKYQRSKQLFDNKILSLETYEQDVKAWKIACEETSYAQKRLNFVLEGYIAGAQGASNTIKSTIEGIVSELPCKEGSVIMERSSHEKGTTVATISDMSTFLFQGRVGEMDVAYLHPGMQFEVSLLAVPGKKFPTTLTKVAPKALVLEGDSSAKFAIEGAVELGKEDKDHVRAGYTAMADIVLAKAIDVLAIQEKWIHTEEGKSTQEPAKSEATYSANSNFVWVYINKKKVKRHVELGVSDGIYVEVKKGLTASDQVITEDDSY